MLTAARPQFDDAAQFDAAQPEVNVLSEKFEQDEQGSYQYGYELDNGQKVRPTTRHPPQQTDTVLADCTA